MHIIVESQKEFTETKGAFPKIFSIFFIGFRVRGLSVELTIPKIFEEIL